MSTQRQRTGRSRSARGAGARRSAAASAVLLALIVSACGRGAADVDVLSSRSGVVERDDDVIRSIEPGAATIEPVDPGEAIGEPDEPGVASVESTRTGATTTEPVEPIETAEPVEPIETAEPVDPGERVGYEMRELRMHPGGLQAQLRRVAFGDGDATASVRFVNGREFDTTLRHDVVLIDDAGERHLAAEAGRIELGEATVVDVEYRFPGADAGRGPFTLLLNDNPEGAYARTASPSFRIGPFEPSTAVVAELPASIGLAGSDADGAAQIRVDGIGFSETSIGVSVTLTNNTTCDIDFANGRSATFLDDDLGNRYPLELGADVYFLRVDEGTSAVGTMVFAGAVDPDASTLTLSTNADGSGIIDPQLVAGPFEISGDNDVPGTPRQIVTDDTVDHPNGTEITLERIDFTEGGVTVDVVVTNRRDIGVRLDLGNTTFLLDDEERQIPLLPPAGNDSVFVAGDSVFYGTLSFPGVVATDARSITLAVNDGQDAERNPVRSGFPEAHFGPYELDRGAPQVGVPPSDFGLVTKVEASHLVRSVGEETPAT